MSSPMSFIRRITAGRLVLACVLALGLSPAAMAAHNHMAPSGRATSHVEHSGHLSVTLDQLMSPVYSTLGNAITTWLPGTRMLFGSDFNATSLHDALPLHEILSRISLGSFKLDTLVPEMDQANRPILPVQDRFKLGDPQYQPFFGLRYLLRFDGPPGTNLTDKWGVNLSVDTRYH